MVPSLYIVTMVTGVMLTLSSHCYRTYVALLSSLATNSCVWHLGLLTYFLCKDPLSCSSLVLSSVTSNGSMLSALELTACGRKR